MKSQTFTSEPWQLPQESTCFPPGQQSPAHSSTRTPMPPILLTCISLLKLQLSFHPGATQRPQQDTGIQFQPLEPTWQNRSHTGSQALGRATKSFRLEQGQETQVSALPYKRYTGSSRDVGLWGLICLKDDKWAVGLPKAALAHGWKNSISN